MAISPPPSAPHFGGVWERLVKSCKVALEIELKNRCLPDDAFRTVIADVEALLNGRPLTHVSVDANDLEPITPNHLIYGRAIAYQPLDSVKNVGLSSRHRVKDVQAVIQTIWTRWLQEYLPNLIERKKWQLERANLQVDDLVLVIKDDTPRGNWPVGRVTEVYHGSDGIVRSASVKIGSSVLKRPVAKLCVLEVEKSPVKTE